MTENLQKLAVCVALGILTLFSAHALYSEPSFPKKTQIFEFGSIRADGRQKQRFQSKWVTHVSAFRNVRSHFFGCGRAYASKIRDHENRALFFQ